MTPFKAPVDDILFTLRACGAEGLDSWDDDLMTQIAEAFASFAEAELAPLDEPSDKQGARFENGRVRMPDGVRAAIDAYAEQGWCGLTAPEEFGGQGLDGLALTITSEIFSGANHAMQMVTGLLPGAIRVLQNFGSDAQQAALIPELAGGERLSTMALTEPGAGSDLGRIRTRATPSGDGWSITGEKIFISNGDQDIRNKILHLVLARTGAADSGVKGLSLFACLSDRADGSRNPVKVTRIEEKMGLHGSPTCQMAFDGAEAQLIGEEGAGLKGMFSMMNHARIGVALQGVAHATRAHAIAAAYTAERQQGRGADGKPVTLDQHPNLAHMLAEARAISLLGRAITHTAVIELERGANPALVDFLTPVAKHFCSKGGSRAADLGMQCLGGYGYLNEYRVEQTWRDARITRIYEGATAIHALTIAGRMAQSPAGDAFANFWAARVDPADLAIWQEGRAALTNPPEQAEDFMALTEWLLCRALAPLFDGHAGAPAVARYIDRQAYLGPLSRDRLAG